MTSDSSEPSSALDGETTSLIREFVKARFPMARTREVSDDTSLLEDGIIDSLGILDIVTHIEEQWGIRIDDEDLNPGNFASIRALAAFVANKRR